MAKLLKRIVVVINVLLLAFGAVCVALGVWAFLQDVEVINLANIDEDGSYGSFRSPGLLEIMAWLCIASGVLIFGLAILALFGVYKDSKWMLALYSSVMVLVVLLLFVSIALGVVLRDRLQDNLKDALVEGIATQYDGTIVSDNTFSYSFDMAQVQFDCCGINNHTEFKSSASVWTERNTLEVPRTCCKLDEYQYVYERLYVFSVSSCAENPLANNSNIDTRCYDDIKDSLEIKNYVLMAISCLVSAVLIVAIVFSCCLLRATSDTTTADYKTHGY